MKKLTIHSGLQIGQPVRLLVPTRGVDDNDVDTVLEPGAIGIISDIADYGAPQHVGVTVVIESQIVNTFDATNGPIDSNMEAIALNADSLLDAETYTNAAETHGSIDDPDHEIGDLQQLFRTAFDMLAPNQKRAFFFHPEVRSVLSSAGIIEEP